MMSMDEWKASSFSCSFLRSKTKIKWKSGSQVSFFYCNKRKIFCNYPKKIFEFFVPKINKYKIIYNFKRCLMFTLEWEKKKTFIWEFLPIYQLKAMTKLAKNTKEMIYHFSLKIEWAQCTKMFNLNKIDSLILIETLNK